MTLKVLIIFLSLFASGLLVGNEQAVAAFIHPVLYSISDEAHVRVAKPLVRRLGRSMLFWYALSLEFAILQMLITRAAPCWIGKASLSSVDTALRNSLSNGSFSMSKSTPFTRHHYRSGFAVQSRHQGGERCVHSALQPWD
jgi:hypothetical protein